MGCFWIFIADLSLSEDFVASDGTIENYNWVTYNQYDNYTNLQMYTIAFYFTVTTITTVGYGDISGHNSTERCICILMMICGVVLFSLISSSIT
jgi:hypothetical protein